ncbi:NupC/NupG family nucleoside CNT transporter [Fuerstiella marisgermanici]|uniref:Nucleoside permease n=1 Tax=Fuerstiella marisgermanici TaxID=1891926 RepID=A0A1P8WS64_9PLAN|nr:NupC/NupG family nucleoside CNT transporter [Fuerstiella marisgermanici]APZ96902.1 Nucleoside permease NupX [Fuerstiella marisgermanici]
MERGISLLGLLVMMLLAWAMSSHKKRVSLRIVGGGLLLQFAFAFLILKTDAGEASFAAIGDFFRSVLSFVDAGSAFLFDVFPRNETETLPAQYTLWRSFAFGILPTIIFFSALMSVMYHLGIMQLVVKALAWLMQKTLGTSGAETLSAAANIFVGQTEAPLVIRPYVADMTMSELNVVMVGGFATIAGGVLAAYVGMGIDAGHLLTASVISAPAALMIAKIMQPETESSMTQGNVKGTADSPSVNVIEAAAEGTSAGLQLALNVGAMLIVFTAFVAMGNAFVSWVGGLVAHYLSYPSAQKWTMELAFGYVFAPFAWLMGVKSDECLAAGGILGVRTVLNEFYAYAQLGKMETPFSLRTQMILTYALCGFANFSSIGIQLGGIGGVAPGRRSDLAKLGLRAMAGGTLAAFMTACVAGFLLSDADLQRRDDDRKANAAAVESADEIKSESPGK